MIRRLLLLLIAFAALLPSRAAQLNPVAIRADDVFLLPELKSNGGVVLQASAIYLDAAGKRVPTKELKLEFRGSTACVVHKNACYAIDAPAQRIIRIAQWIDRNRTSAFTMHLHADDAEVDKFVRTELTPVATEYVRSACFPRDCFVATEFAGKMAELLLYTIDFTIYVKPLEDAPNIMRRLNVRPGVVRCSKANAVDGSYVNTDVDSKFVARLSKGKAEVSGSLLRYSWRECAGGTMPFISGVESLEEPSEATGSYHGDAIQFARTVALLRAFEEPSQLSMFIASAPVFH